MHVVFVIPGCRSHSFNVNVTQLGDALDTLLQHTSRPLHVDVLMVARHHSNDITTLLECLSPNMRHGVSAVNVLLEVYAVSFP
ncbi:hypothetical protein MRX96_037528 [Rhipicephalus microplus]